MNEELKMPEELEMTEEQLCYWINLIVELAKAYMEEVAKDPKEKALAFERMDALKMKLPAEEERESKAGEGGYMTNKQFAAIINTHTELAKKYVESANPDSLQQRALLAQLDELKMML